MTTHIEQTSIEIHEEVTIEGSNVHIEKHIHVDHVQETIEPVNVSTRRPIATKETFDAFRKEALDFSPEWLAEYDKNRIQVFLKNSQKSNITRVKTRGIFPTVKPDILFKSLIHDEYTRHCDTNMAQWVIVEQIDNSNDISYYASKIPQLIAIFVSPRDFLSQRAYGQTGKDEYMIVLSSIKDDRQPPKKKWVRAEIIITGFLIRKHEEGCELIYLSQTDLKGKIPKKAINFGTKKVGPSIIRQFETDALKFPEWERTKMKTKTLPIYPAYEGANFEEES